MSDIKQEELVKEQPIPVSLEGTKKILFQMENCICKIYLKNNDVIGTGFFCKIPFNNNLLPVLITNNHILNKDDIDNDKIIKLMINNKIKQIEIDNSRKKYINSDKNIDITIIEIKPNKDGINNYLEIYYINKDKESLKLDYKKKSIYIIHYPNEELSVSYGLIKDIIDNKKVEHYCITEKGSSGSPILSLKTFKVIGINYGSSQKIKINYGTYIKYAIEEFNNKYKNEINIIYKTDKEDEENIFREKFVKNNNYKNEINIIYKTNKEGEENIFGENFVKNNKNNIELIINGNKNELISRYKLKEGENNIKIRIKNKITHLEYMFYECKSLKNIEELEYLDTKDINDFSSMFYGCSSLSYLKGLENWNVSNGNDFSYMFYRCSSLSELKELENWNVSNGIFFSCMFQQCSSLSDLKGLEHWNVSNGNDFNYMFNECSSLSDIKGLENWNVSNGNDFSWMFSNCSSLSDIKGLENWNVSYGIIFSYMFYYCSSLSDIKGLENWNVSNGNNFSCMFRGCSTLLDIKGLENWNLPDNKYKSMI